MRSVLEALAGAALLFYCSAPYQNHELAIRLCLILAILWALVLVVRRSRAVFSTESFFHAAVLLAFYLRAGLQEPWMNGLSQWLLAGQWTIVLYLKLRNPEDSAGPSLFLALSLVSPLYCQFLEDPRTGILAGVALWVLPLLHACFRIELPRAPRLWLAALAWLALSIPFALYAWSSAQHLLILTACLLLYAACRVQLTVDPLPIKTAYFWLTVSLAIFFIPREVELFTTAGFSTLHLRRYFVEHPNTASPLFTILAAFWLHHSQNRWLTWSGFAFLALIQVLTFSRSGWVGFAVFVACFLWLSTGAKKLRLLLPALAILILAVAAISPLRSALLARATSSEDLADRMNNWKIGIAAAARHPWTGTGWFNYYNHAAHLPDAGEFDHLDRNRRLVAVHNHSMPLDLAETAGIPFAVLLLAFVALHLKQPSRVPALFAGLAGVAINSLLDTGAFWLTVFPHLIVLLAGLAPAAKETIQPTARAVLAVAVLLVACVLPLAEDHFIQQGTLAWLKSSNPEALQSFRRAAFLAPLDALPLEKQKDILLADSSMDAVRILNRLTRLRKDFAPTWLELGKLTGDHASMERARALDPQVMLSEPTYLELADLAFKTHRENDGRQFLYSHLMHQPWPFDPRTRMLVDRFDEKAFLEGALDLLKHSATDPGDWYAAVDLFSRNLVSLRKRAAAASFLLKASQQYPASDGGWQQQLCFSAASALVAANESGSLPELARSNGGGCADVIHARLAVSAGNEPEARKLLTQARDELDPEYVIDAFEAYSRAFSKPDVLAGEYRFLYIQPNQAAPDPRWLQRIADLEFAQHRYQDAAGSYHRAAVEFHASPDLFWKEARCLYLAGKEKEAAAANGTLQALIPDNLLLENLYRSRINTGKWETKLTRIGVESELGGRNWHTVIFAPPPSEIVLPPELLLKHLRGKVLLVSGAWLEPTDGVEFEVQGGSGALLASATIDRNNHEQSLEWSGTAEPITLKTLPLQSEDYDWAAWDLHPIP